MTSLSTDFTPSVFTNYGMPADIAAPGGDLYYHKISVMPVRFFRRF